MSHVTGIDIDRVLIIQLTPPVTITGVLGLWLGTGVWVCNTRIYISRKVNSNAITLTIDLCINNVL